MKVNCCKDCTDRYVGCHSSCDTYIETKEKYDELQKKIRKQKAKESPYHRSKFREL